MSFAEDGFLSEEIKLFWAETEKKYSGHLQFAYSLNKMAQVHKNAYLCCNLDYRKALANCLFLKILNGFQSCIILIKHGLPFEAVALSRTLCDPIYLLKIFICDKEFWRKFINYDTYDFRKKINVATANPHSVVKSAREINTEQFMAKLTGKLVDFDKNEFKVEELAKKAGMLSHYDTMFRFASDEIHCGPRVFFHYVKLDDMSCIMNYDCGPLDNHYDRIIVSTSDVLLKAISFMDDIHQIPHPKEFDELSKQWQELNQQTS